MQNGGRRHADVHARGHRRPRGTPINIMSIGEEEQDLDLESGTHTRDFMTRIERQPHEPRNPLIDIQLYRGQKNTAVIGDRARLLQEADRRDRDRQGRRRRGRSRPRRKPEESTWSWTASWRSSWQRRKRCSRGWTTRSGSTWLTGSHILITLWSGTVFTRRNVKPRALASTLRWSRTSGTLHGTSFSWAIIGKKMEML